MNGELRVLSGVILTGHGLVSKGDTKWKRSCVVYILICFRMNSKSKDKRYGGWCTISGVLLIENSLHSKGGAKRGKTQVELSGLYSQVMVTSGYREDV